MAAERPRILQLGPEVRGGMTAVMRDLLESPLADLYEMEMVATHKGSGATRRLLVFAAALRRLTWWSLRGRGRVVHIHSTVRGSMYRKALCVLLARMLRRRVVLHLHSGPGDIAAFRSRLGGTRVALLRLSLRAADVVLAVSRASAAALEEAFHIDGVAVVPNAAPTVPVAEAGHPGEGEPLAVFLGGFANPVKGGEAMVEALTAAAPAGLRIALAGPGEPPPAAHRLLAERDGVEWRGWLDDGAKGALMSEASVFVLSSTSEGLPMALLEAMAYGLAIVATEVGGVPDVLDDEVDALLVPPGDPAALAAALTRFAGDAELRARLGSAARRRAERLNADEVTGRLDAIYRGLLV